MGLVKDATAGGNVWQMDKDLGADDDDGTFMEASPTQDSQAEEEEDGSFPVVKPAATGLHTEPESIPEREALHHYHYHTFDVQGRQSRPIRRESLALFNFSDT